MIEYRYFSPFSSEELEFEGAHVYMGKENSMLISRQGRTIILSNEIAKRIEFGKINDDIAFKLYQRGFGMAFSTSRFEEVEDKPMPTLFMIDFTTKCNCNCIYCLRHFENVGDSIDKTMLDKICKYIIDYCKTHGIRQISFQPWGGEPLIELDAIIASKKMFEANGINARYNIQTNGLLLTLKNYELLRENNIDIGVSIDGLDVVHDAHRLDVRGNKTHAKIVSNLKAIKEKYPDARIASLSVSSGYSKDHVYENVEYLVSELGFDSLKFNLVHPNETEGFDKEMLIKDKEIDAFCQDLLGAIINQHEKGNECYEANITDRLINLTVSTGNNVCNSRGCRGGYSFISFDREGNIYPCEMIGKEDMRLGNVNDKEDLISLIYKAQANGNPYYKEREIDSCNNCPFLPYCKGGCKACAMAYGKKASEIDPMECAYNKAIYPKLIELILENPQMAQRLLNRRIVMNGAINGAF